MDEKMKELADALLKLQPEQRATVIAMVEYAASHGVGGKKRGRPANGAVVDARQTSIQQEQVFNTEHSL